MTEVGAKLGGWEKSYLTADELRYDFFTEYQLYEVFSDPKGYYVLDDLGTRWYDFEINLT